MDKTTTILTLRLPEGVREMIKLSAQKSNRSMHAETVVRLGSGAISTLPDGFNSSSGRGSDQFSLRLPLELHSLLTEQANQHGRSINAEMVMRIVGSFHGEGTAIPLPNHGAAAGRTSSRTLSIKLSNEQMQVLNSSARIGPYTINIEEVVARGIELALREIADLADMRKVKNG